jgi:predicted dehydrogenase
MGIQGIKRKKYLGNDFIYSVDKFKSADFKSISDVPLKDYDAVFICLPDDEKFKVVKYCIENKKHILIEKPIFFKDLKNFSRLQKMARQNKVVCYTAYNHRFEPHFIKMKKIINSKKLGKLYSCRIFYGNGTAKLVKKNWRDRGKGVRTDLLPHLLDVCRFWFGKSVKEFKLISSSKFENKAPDHALFISERGRVKINLEISYVMWKNTFSCDLLASKGSAHINNLCKWGKSTFTFRKRKFPSGKPSEEKKILSKKDPTWHLEYQYFKNLIKKKIKTDFSNDIWIQKQMKKN